MQTQTVTPGNIEVNGVSSVLKTLGYTILGAALTAVFATIYHFNFGGYEALAMIVLPSGFKFLEKLLLPYNITVTDPVQ